MKKVSFFGTICMSMLVAVFMVVPRVMAAGKTVNMSEKTFKAEHAADMKAEKLGEVFVMSGKVKAAEPQYHTAVVECPVGGQMFTVAGPLAPQAMLKKGGKSVQLKAFKEGEHVQVKWQATENGHLILMLAAK
jgi:hypothetical protein